MHIGLIGGIGPAATVVYYERLVRRFREAGRVLDLTIVQADVDTLVANALADRKQEQTAVYVGLIERLKNAGADVAAITSIGGHFCYDVLEPIAPLPLLSAITPMDDWFQRHGIGTIGVLGTTFVMDSHLYGQLEATKSVVPAGNVEEVGTAYRLMAVAGECTTEQRALFFRAGDAMMKTQKADAILLGGTDLGLAFDGEDPGFPIIDAVDIHVEALAAAAGIVPN